MKKICFLMFLLILIVGVSVACQNNSKDDIESTSTIEPSAASSATSTPEATFTPTSAVTADPIASPTIEPTEEATEKEIKINYITNGLFALYEGKYNTLDGFDDVDFWDDLSGNENHIDFVDNDGENVFFDADKGLYINGRDIFFPESIVEMINTNKYTVELKLSDLTLIGGDFATIINNHCSGNKGNDNFALFIRRSNGVVEFKNSTNSRPKADNGFDLINEHTITVTFDLEKGFCKLYSDGVLLSESVPAAEMGVNMLLFIGHSTAEKKFSAYIQSVRFYDRALSDAEVLQNATVVEAITVD